MSPSAGILLAQLPLGPQPSKVPGFIASDLFMIISISILIFLVFFVWIAIVRGPKNQIPARRIYKSGHSSPSTQTEDTEDGRRKRRKKKKTRRREHRGRNPTLSEAGGLPAPRPPEQPASNF
jgi:hypothetical protein